MTDIPKSVSAYMSKIGAKGGAKGRGKPKTRTCEQYAAMGRKSAAARKRKAAKK